MPITRRLLLKLAAAAGIAGPQRIIGASVAHAEDGGWRHGLSLFGNLKYPESFTHFDYVNPQAPRGGRVRLYSIGSFDNLNPYTYKGNSGGLIGLSQDTLTASAFDEPSSAYGLIAEAMKHPDDFSSVTYRLREGARFHDGTPITVEDAIWSMTALKQAHPAYNFYYKDVEAAEQTGEREVTYRFAVKGNRELPHIVGQLPVLPKAWWTGKDQNGKQRSIDETTLEIPLGNGAYTVSDVKPARSITVSRVKDYWAGELPVNVGQNNFDEITVVYFRDDTIALEAFKSDQYDYRAESSAKNWATAYDFPAARAGKVKTEKITLKNPEGMQAFAFNLRRDKFADVRVRRALNLAFDFEWANENLFYGQYVRTASYFANSELAATGLPGPEELEILEPLRGEVPDEVFTSEYTNPVNATPQEKRTNLRQAAKLLWEAGWTIGADQTLHNAKGEPFEFEFLLVSPAFERIVLPYKAALELLGIKASVRTVDSSQYERRTQTFDFDCVVANWPQSLSPGNEQRDFFGSASADRNGSRNLAGIKDPAVDALIDRIIFAKDRPDLVAATKAMDRVLLWNNYVLPTWHIPYERVAYWNRFGRPDKLPDFSIGFPTIWWWDDEKAEKVKAG